MPKHLPLTLCDLTDYILTHPLYKSRAHLKVLNVPVYAGRLGEQARAVVDVQITVLSDGTHQAVLVLSD